MREQTPVVFMAFDLLYRGDSLLLEQPLTMRRAHSKKSTQRRCRTQW